MMAVKILIFHIVATNEKRKCISYYQVPSEPVLLKNGLPEFKIQNAYNLLTCIQILSSFHGMKRRNNI